MNLHNKNINEIHSNPTANKNIKSKLDIINIQDNLGLSEQYANICEQYGMNNKWILLINPDDDPLINLNLNKKIDVKNILKVKAKNQNLELKNIEKTLCKGNCSAIVLCNPILNHEDIEHLNRCAQLGQTQCIIIKNKQELH